MQIVAPGGLYVRLMYTNTMSSTMGIDDLVATFALMFP